MPEVVFYPDNIKVEVAEGENLLRAAMIAEVHINASCGGDGTCGKCRVIVESGEVECLGTGKLTAAEIKRGYCLACLALVKSDLDVRVPVESQMGDSKILERERRIPTWGHFLAAPDAEVLATGWKLSPPTWKRFVKLPPPSIEDSLSDLDRLRREIGRQLSLREVGVDPAVLKDLASSLRGDDWQVTLTFLEADEETRLTRVESGDTTDRNYALAVDVGTTTVIAQLVDLVAGKVAAKASNYNGQISYGEDVITRIIFAGREGGLLKLQSAVVATVNSLISEIIRRAQIETEDISYMIAAGNTTMTHLLLGLDPKYVREEPYIPTVSSVPLWRARELGISLSPNVYMYCLPGVASYVGGDITAGILGSGVFQSDKLTLYIDIGTNGELVLGNSEWLVSCSCSAGPAFEGGGIKNGMRATRGAIEQVRISRETLEPMILTIGQSKPKGICGSGLIDVVAEFFLSGVINQKGKFNTELKTPRLRMTEGGPEYVLAWAEETSIGRDITITEVDLDNLIRAKGAIYAGISILTESVDIGISDIERIIIAGAFGNYIEVDKAMIIGLLPETDAGKFMFIGNGSLMGARAVSLSRELKEIAEGIAKKMTYLELSVNPSFMDRYVSALFLPHTNVDAFPKVMGLLKQRG
jgi:uncharacterized 2Fe-2S/4Fe-4S cluster protein (DUF4445 family)